LIEDNGYSGGYATAVYNKQHI